MGEAAEALEFERAARLRDRISALSAIQGEQSVNPRTVPEADVFAIAEEAGQFCIEAFFFRTYQNWGNRAYFPRADARSSAAEVLDAFLAQFYSSARPRASCCSATTCRSAATLREILSRSRRPSHRHRRRQRGEKKELVEMPCATPARRCRASSPRAASQEKLLAALGQTFGMANAPRRVEVYDNSHIMGTNAIGAMIVAGPEGFVKGQYRTFNIKSEALTPGDDYAMMREVLTRRFTRLMRESAEDEPRANSPTSPIWCSSTAAAASSRPRGR